MVNLSVKEVAELKGCTERYIQTLIERGKLPADEVDGLAAGRGGVQYRIPLEALDAKLQLKFKRLLKKREKESGMSEPEPEDTAPFDCETLTAAERTEISDWKLLLNDWRKFRVIAAADGVSAEEADEQYIRLCNSRDTALNLNRQVLYRKWKAMREKGEAALMDRRGKHGNHAKKLTPEMWDVFENFYLDETRKSVQLCMTLTRRELERSQPDLSSLPTSDTFERRVKKIPLPYVLYFRYGEKAFIGECSPYIKRMYDDLEPNDIWVADNHTFDIMLYDGQKPVRLYLTAFMDVRTRKMMGWCVTDNPCSDATLYALKKGIEKHGIPKMIYTDNGREFLFHDFGGSGFRKKKLEPGELKPPSILKDLGIEFRTALPRNARAKGVERAFRTVKDTFSKLFTSYTGGNVLEKPEQLKEVLKRPDKLKTVEEFTGFVDTYLAGGYNKQPHSGEGMYGRSPDEAYVELLVEKRAAAESQLNLMFMRWSNPMMVGKNGVTLTFYGKKLQYYDESIWLNYSGKKVYVRYSPDDLKQVRIYDLDESFIGIAQLKAELSYAASKEEIAEHQKTVRSAQKAVKNYKKLKDIQTHDALELEIDEAVKEIGKGDKADQAVLRLMFGREEYPKAVGFGGEADEPINWTAALDSLKQRKGEDYGL